jgi:DUF971 family protein
MIPKKIKIKDKTDLLITWKDDTESSINLKYLRDECPCAGCKGETILLRTYRPPKPQMFSPEMYKVKSIDPVGGYAVQIAWKDGHNTGIYTFDYLRQLASDQESGKNQNYDRLL